MSNIDDEVVRMRFDNGAFSRGVTSTIGMLSKLKSSLSFTGADKGLSDVEAKANKLDMSGMNKQIDESAHHWSAWRTAGLIAFATVVHRAVNAGINVVKAFTINPISAGFKNYETQINAIQTILANTGLKGKAGLDKVNGALSELNTYANQTVYNFSEMAKNIGTFTAAGVKLKPATNAIKGIANLAALSGSSSEQASTAMYQLSQAIAANKVGLQDWNSVVNAGMGGKVFQNALFNVGKMQHTLKGVKANETFDQWTKAGNSFRQSLQKGWITGKVLTTTLSQFTGDLTDAQLKAQGYNKTQIAQIQQLAKTASGAATHIKTMSQLTDALKEEVATAYGAIFKTIFGDINGATKLFSGIHTVVENALTVPIYKLNTFLQQVSALGGRTKMIDAFKNSFHALGAVLKPIKDAFREIFPPTSAAAVADMISKFDDFTKRLTISGDTASKVHRTFAGFFAIFDIARQAVHGVITVFVDLFKALDPGSAGNGLLSFTANLGDMVVNFDKALRKGGALTTFFHHIGDILATPVAMISTFAHALGGMFGGFHASDAHGVTRGLDIVNKALTKVESYTNKFKKSFDNLAPHIKNGVDAIAHVFSGLGDSIAHAISSQGFENVLKVIQTGLLAGILLTLKKFMSGGLGGFHVDVGKGIFGQAKEALEGVTGSLKAMQMQLKAKALLEIAISMGVLAASMVVLANTNANKLGSALQAMAVGFGELLGSMAILTKVTGSAGFVKIPIMAASMDLLATSILILAGAVKILASMSWDELKKGLTAVGALLAEVTAAALIISKNSASMISAGIGITAMAVAMSIMAGAVKLFSMMSWKDILKGLAGVGGALLAIAIGMKLMPGPSMALTAAGLIEVAAAINGIYFAVKNFSTLSWKDLLKGLTGVAGALVGIGAAMRIMPKGMIVQAAGLALVAGSLFLIEKVMASMAKMSWGTIIHGLGAIALALGVLAIAMHAMSGTVSGAASLAIVAGSLALLLPIIEKLGNQSWGEIAKGLITLAAALAILVIASAAAEAVTPGLLALSVAAIAIGAGLALAGAGIGALSAGLGVLAASGSAGIAVLIAAIAAIIAKIPALAVAFADGLVQILVVIGKNGPAIVAAIGSILSSILTAIINNAPKMATAFEKLVEAALGVIVKESPKIIAAGLRILMDLLHGIENNIGKIVKTVGNIIVNFLNAVSRQLPRIINAGVNLLEKFLIGIANALGRMPSIVLKVIAAFINSLLNNNGKIVSQGAKMIGSLIGGIVGALGRIISAGLRVVSKFISSLASGAASIVAAGIHFVSHLFSGIGQALKEVPGKILDLASQLGKDLINGIIHGVGGLASSLASKIKGAIGSGLGKLGHFLGIGGPSQLFADEIGAPIMMGITQGIDKNNKMVADSLQNAAGNALSKFHRTLQAIPDSINAMDNLSPTITPVLDLTAVQKDASKISGMVAANPINATVSTTSAAAISADQLAAAAAAADTASQPTPAPATTITFQQTNQSPKALSAVDIYRQTSNLISQAKRQLNVPTPQTTQ